MFDVYKHILQNKATVERIGVIYFQETLIFQLHFDYKSMAQSSI